MNAVYRLVASRVPPKALPIEPEFFCRGSEVPVSPETLVWNAITGRKRIIRSPGGANQSIGQDAPGAERRLRL